MSAPYETVGVVGAGAAGRGLAHVVALSGRAVVAYDPSPSVLAAARNAAAACAPPIVWTDDLANLAAAELLIEAVAEGEELTRGYFAELEAVGDRSAALVSSTCFVGLSDVAAGMARPERFAGLHFAGAAPDAQLVEVVAAAATPLDLLDDLAAFVESLGKTPIRCADTPGFILRRCARPYFDEALAILEEGARGAAEIDAACVAAGYETGPFELIDRVGADAHLAEAESLYDALGGHPRRHLIGALKRRVADGRLVREAGDVFITSGSSAAAAQDAAEIVGRIEAMLVNEAASLVDQGGASEDDVDAALRLGMNFPRGPFEIAGAVGRGAVVDRLERLEDRSPAELAGRYEPTDYLQRAAYPFWAECSPLDCDAAYDNMAAIPDAQAHLERLPSRAAAFIAEADVCFDEIAYGPDPRQKLDLVRPKRSAAGLVVFLHGGYWRRTDKSFWSHVASGVAASGWAAALPSYRLAPSVRLSEIQRDAQAAVLRAVSEAPGPITLIGHSAGGQLAMRLMCDDVALAQDVRDRVRRCVSISGLHDLRPLLRNTMNSDLRLDAAEARELSPRLRQPIDGPEFQVWVGANELPAFHAQAEALETSWRRRGARISSHVAPDADHLTVLDALERVDGPVLQAALAD